MIVSGDCTAFLARGRGAGREPPQWTIEERGRGCSHPNDLLQPINLAAVRPNGRAIVASVRARREPDSRAWELGSADPALPEWGLIAADGELLFRVRARDAIGARELFRVHSLGREGDRVRRLATNTPASPVGWSRPGR